MELKKLEEILRLFESTSLNRMELEEDGIKLKLEKNLVNETVAPIHYSIPASAATPMPSISPAPLVKEEVKEVGTWVKAPIVGTIYSARSEKEEPFISEGQAVKKGDILCIIEAMKVMNEIRAPFDGVVRQISIQNDTMVEFDQSLVLLEQTNV